MLTQRELSDLMDRVRIPEVGRKVVDQIRNAPPARRVRSGAHNVSSRLPSRKMKRTIQAESHTNELARILCWEHDPATFEFYDQPPRIRLSYKDVAGRIRNDPRTVDFFIIQDDFIGWVECKTEKWLEEHRAGGGQLYEKEPSGTWICPAGNEYAQLLGLGFKVLSNISINRIYCRNLEFLSDYLVDGLAKPDQELVSHFSDQVRAVSQVPLRDLLNSSTAEQNDVLYRLIAEGRLYVDLERQALAEPDRTLVFRSQAAAEAYFAVEAGRALEARRPTLSVSVAENTVLSLDGRPWRVLTVGNAETVIVDAEGRIVRLKPTELESMIKEGLITGATETVASEHDRAQKVMLAASDKDLKDALQRQRILNGHPLPSDKTPSRRMLTIWRRWAREGEKLYGQAFLGLIRHSARKGTT